MRPGPTNTLTDVPGFRVGHQTRTESGWLTGTTVVVAPPGGAIAGVDVRGAAPGTRETDLLDPRNLVDRVDAIVLTGGSAFGLAAADGVMHRSYAAGRGWPVGAPPEVVPIVPAAVLFDLGRGGDFTNHPGPEDGAVAYDRATTDPVAQGCIGAGTGAKAGALKGGIGSASQILSDGSIVAALVAVNAAGSTVDLADGQLYAARWGVAGEFDRLAGPSADEVARHRAERAVDLLPLPGTATTIGVIATDLGLTKAQCQKLAGVGHDGIARAVRPAHTSLDGDTLFALATGARPLADIAAYIEVQDAAATCVARAIGQAILAAESALMWPGTEAARQVRSYRDAFPSALTAAGS